MGQPYWKFFGAKIKHGSVCIFVKTACINVDNNNLFHHGSVFQDNVMGETYLALNRAVSIAYFYKF